MGNRCCAAADEGSSSDGGEEGSDSVETEHQRRGASLKNHHQPAHVLPCSVQMKSAEGRVVDGGTYEVCIGGGVQLATAPPPVVPAAAMRRRQQQQVSISIAVAQLHPIAPANREDAAIAEGRRSSMASSSSAVSCSSVAASLSDSRPTHQTDPAPQPADRQRTGKRSVSSPLSAFRSTATRCPPSPLNPLDPPVRDMMASPRESEASPTARIITTGSAFGRDEEVQAEEASLSRPVANGSASLERPPHTNRNPSMNASGDWSFNRGEHRPQRGQSPRTTPLYGRCGASRDGTSSTASFDDPDTPSVGPPRVSFNAHAVVFNDDDEDEADASVLCSFRNHARLDSDETQGDCDGHLSVMFDVSELTLLRDAVHMASEDGVSCSAPATPVSHKMSGTPAQGDMGNLRHAQRSPRLALVPLPASSTHREQRAKTKIVQRLRSAGKTKTPPAA